MFDSLLTHINIATCAEGPGYGIIEDAYIGVNAGKISFMGRMSSLKKDPASLAPIVYDGQKKWATPGLVDCHTHLVYAGNRAHEFEKRLQGISYADIAKEGGGILSTVRATRATPEDELLKLTHNRITQMIRSGTTTFEIKSGYGLDLATERKMLRVATRLRDEYGFRIQRTFLGAHALPPEFSDTQSYVDHICSDMMPKLAAEGLIDTVDVFCEGIGFSRAQTEQIFRKAGLLSLPVKIHAEQLSNLQGAALAAQHKAMSADHLEYLDDNGVKAMATAGMTAVLLPGAFYYLREKQLPPIDLLRKYHVPMAIATDHNPGTSPTLSLPLMVNMACTLFRLTPEESLAGVTRHAARALGLLGVCGTLEVGKAADIAVWDIDHPRDLAYAFGHNPCTRVFIDGQEQSF